MDIEEENEESLRIGASNGDLVAVQRLVNELGTNPSASDDCGTGALIAAAEHGQNSILSYLIQDCGLDPSVSDNGGWSALHVAAAGGHDNTWKLLKILGANPKQLTKDGRSYLFVATAGNHVSTCKLILDESGDEFINLVTKDGWSCLYISALFGHHSVFHLLLERGADCDLRTYGESIKTVSQRRGYSNMVESLQAVDDMKEFARSGKIDLIRKGIVGGEKMCLAPIAQWYQLLTPALRFDLNKWALCCLNDAASCFCALFGKPHRSIFREAVAHDGLQHVLFEIRSYLVYPQSATRRMIREISKVTGVI